MTYDPGRDPTDPLDVNPNQRRYQGFRDNGSGMFMLLGILAILILGGLFFYSMGGDRTVATNDTRPAATAPSTTSAAAPRRDDRDTDARAASDSGVRNPRPGSLILCNVA